MLPPMNGEQHNRVWAPRQRLPRTLVAGLLALSVLAVGWAAVAGATRGKTRSAATTISPGELDTVGTKCPARTHASGGGFWIRPGMNPADGGFDTPEGPVSQRSISVGAKGWSSSGASNAGDPARELRSFVRCETNRDGRIPLRLAGQTTITPVPSSPPWSSYAATLRFICPVGTHALSGGYSTDNHVDPSDDAGDLGVVVVQNRRTGFRVWSITGFVIGTPNSTPHTLAGRVACERNGRPPVTTRARTVAYADNLRNGATATCPKRRHVVAGGFRVTPLPAVGSDTTVAYFDRTSPVRSRSWRAEAWDSLIFAAPPGVKLTTYAYCRANRLARRRGRSASAAAAPVIGEGSVTVERSTGSVQPG